MHAASANPTVSIVIPAYNEGRVIGQCLRSIAELEYDPSRIEVVLMDNGSSDQTTLIAESFGARVHVRTDLSVAGLRNAGVAASASEVVAFLDADCVADSGWLRAAVSSLRQERCITGSPYLNPDPPHWIERAWHSTELTGRYPTTHLNAGNLVVWREDFLRIGGFDETLVTGEDYEFAQRAAATVKVVADDSIAVTHLGNPRSISAFFRREVWHGLGALGSLRHSLRDKPFWGTVVFATGLLMAVLGATGLFGARSVTVAAAGLALSLGVALSSTAFRARRRLPAPLELVQLTLLFVVFYAGRSVALARIALGWKNYRRSK
jgi:glycosyltransferase involved in cell wall biosynthesis